MWRHHHIVVLAKRGPMLSQAERYCVRRMGPRMREGGTQAKHTAATGGSVADTVCQLSPASLEAHTPPVVEPISR